MWLTCALRCHAMPCLPQTDFLRFTGVALTKESPLLAAVLGDSTALMSTYMVRAGWNESKHANGVALQL